MASRVASRDGAARFPLKYESQPDMAPRLGRGGGDSCWWYAQRQDLVL